MNTNIDTLKSFIEKIRSIGFFRKLFGWKKVRNELIDVAAALSSLTTELELSLEKQNELQNSLSDNRKDLQIANEQKTRLEEVQKQHNGITTEKDRTIAETNKQLTTANTNCKNLEKQVHDLELRIGKLEEKLRESEQHFAEANKERIEMNYPEAELRGICLI